MKKSEFDKVFDAAKEELSAKDGEDLVLRVMQLQSHDPHGVIDPALVPLCVAAYCVKYTNDFLYRVLSEVLIDEPD